jgi:uncharacterized membrane protein
VSESLSRHEADSVEAVLHLHREHHEAASTAQRLIDRVTGQLGRPAAALILIGGLTLWTVAAARLTGGQMDQPIFAWLEYAATVSALMISVLILVTQRRADELAERRARLTLELALLADRRSAKIIALLEELRRDHPEVRDRIDPESEAMATPADPEAVVAAIDEKAVG